MPVHEKFIASLFGKSEQQERAEELKANGWTNNQIKKLFKQEEAENIGSFTASNLMEHPVTGAPITVSAYATELRLNRPLTTAQLTKQAKINDWRVRLHLPPGAKHLYNGEDPGILYPLKTTDGIIFPYTPTINVQYNANYENYDLVHSNYRGYFYKGSNVQNVLLTATFTAQDTNEANYMLAAMHFLRSCTKMFYGKDNERGIPPPIVFLTGFGEYQFKNHPCAITMVNYNLPNDVDYIAAGKTLELFNPRSNFIIHKQKIDQFGKKARLRAARVAFGGYPANRLKADNKSIGDDTEITKAYEGVTYVPTKIDISFTMLPIQTRTQVSTEFSLAEYASGKLLKGGFW